MTVVVPGSELQAESVGGEWEGTQNTEQYASAHDQLSHWLFICFYTKLHLLVCILYVCLHIYRGSPRPV